MGYRKTINIVTAIVLFICSIGFTAITANADTIINLIPDQITTQTNLSGTFANLIDDPNFPDNNWLTAKTLSANTDVRGSLENNTEALKEVGKLQTVTFRIRKAPVFLGLSGTPTADLYVYEAGNSTPIAKTEQSLDVADSMMHTLTFDATSLADKTGSNLEWRVFGKAFGGILGLLATTVEVGAVRFNALLSIAPFGPPPNFKTTQITANSIDLQWDPVYKASSYQVKRNGIVVYTGSNTNFSDTGLTDATDYNYEVCAYNGSYFSDPSTLTARTLGTLSISVPSIANFPNVVFENLTETVTTHFNSGLLVKNTTGTNLGWNVTVQASQFQESGGLQLPKGALTLKPPSSFVKLNGPASGNPDNAISSPAIIDNGSAVKIITANPGNGEGEYQVNFPADALSFTIDLPSITADKLNKTYHSTLTFTIVEGP
jgi:hypothetical protein